MRTLHDQQVMDDEFGAMSTWTAEVVATLGKEYAVPGACRGTGGPSAMCWLLDRMVVLPGEVLLDVGAGMGGPTEYAVETRGLRPVLLEPDRHAAAASQEMFGRPVAVATGARLPVADTSVGALWALGVLCTSDEQVALLTELSRVVRPGGPVGLLVYVRTTSEHVADAPGGNHFPTVRELVQMMGETGLSVRDDAFLDELHPDPDPAWDRAERRVADEIEARHHGDPVWQSAHQQETRIGKLLADGSLRGLLVVCSTPYEE